MSSDPASWPVFANGRFVAPDVPVLCAGDQGFTLGLSVFDSLVFEGGVALFLEEHLARLERGARGVGIPWPPPWDVAATLAELAARVGREPLVLRTTLSRGAPGAGTTMTVAARPVVSPPAEGARVWVPSARIQADAAVDGLKSTNRLRNVLAREEATRHGAWEAFLVDGRDRVLEGTISNVFVRFGDELRTAPLELGCLGGITREQLLASAADDPLVAPDGRALALVERATTLAELAGADEVVLTNSSGRATGVLSIEGAGPPLAAAPVRDLPGATGDAARALNERIRRLEADYRSRTRAAGRCRPADRDSAG